MCFLFLKGCVVLGKKAIRLTLLCIYYKPRKQTVCSNEFLFEIMFLQRRDDDFSETRAALLKI